MQTTERINRIKNWIIDYCKNMPIEAKTLVIGVSGGIDSSVTSTLCALTGKKTIILSMPINQIKDQHDLSLKHQEWLKNKFKNVEGHIIKLDNVFDNFKNSLSNFKKFSEILSKVAVYATNFLIFFILKIFNVTILEDLNFLKLICVCC